MLDIYELYKRQKSIIQSLCSNLIVSMRASCQLEWIIYIIGGKMYRASVQSDVDDYLEVRLNSEI